MSQIESQSNKRSADQSAHKLSNQLSGSNQKRQKLTEESYKNVKPLKIDEESEGERTDDNSDKNSKTKWKTLEHHGMTFPAAYKPLPKDVRVKYSKDKGGEKIEFPIEVEEIACWWSEAEVTEFGEKQKSKENFWLDFKSKLDKSKFGSLNLEDLDFSDVRAHLQNEKEIKKSRPTEVKKKETEDQQKNGAAYQICYIDGKPEKVSNYCIEPPGLFRGRGEHPSIGRVKHRVVPEYATINIGYDDPIPPCPISGHSWKGVINNTEATWLCHFKDEKNTYSKSKKYLFLAAESDLKAMNDKKKYERARRLRDIIDDVRALYNKKMSSDSKESQMIGVATFLIDRLALRVGNEKGEDEADTVGCCSLRVEHLTLQEPNKVTFDFLGKDSMRYLNTIEVPDLVYKTIKSFFMKPGEKGMVNKEPKEELFDLINAGKLNDHLKSHMPDLSAKVFRTYNASVTLQKQLEEHTQASSIKIDSNVDTKVKFFTDCNREVAILCNHKKAESKNLKEQLEKMEIVISDKKKEIKDLEALKKKLNSGKAPDDPTKKLPKTGDECQKKITKLKEQVSTEEHKLQNKKDNSQVALETSKINYMDPRITISWCKRKDVPIEKVFNKTLRSKFAWAMDNNPEWNF